MEVHQDEKDCLTDEELSSLQSPDIDEETRQTLVNKISTCVYCKRKLILSLYPESAEK